MMSVEEHAKRLLLGQKCEDCIYRVLLSEGKERCLVDTSIMRDLPEERVCKDYQKPFDPELKNLEKIESKNFKLKRELGLKSSITKEMFESEYSKIFGADLK